MTQGFYEILSNVTIAKDIYEMVLGGDTSAITAPGQFINIKVEGFYLRRPISICDWDEKTITILFKTVGEGTQRLSEMKVGEKLDILVGLGNGFDVNACGENPLLVGGGIGNMIDRVYLGYVIDFIDVRLINFAVFNIADSFVTVGAFLFMGYMIYDTVMEYKREKETAAKKQEAENTDVESDTEQHDAEN